MVNVKQITIFGIIGVLNTSIDIGVFIFLKSILNIDNQSNWIVLINLTAIVAAIIFSYFANKNFTFKNKSKTNSREISSFLIVNLLGFIVNTTILRLTITILPINLTLPLTLILIDPALIAKIIATIASMVVSFIGYKFFVFHK